MWCTVYTWLTRSAARSWQAVAVPQEYLQNKLQYRPDNPIMHAYSYRVTSSSNFNKLNRHLELLVVIVRKRSHYNNPITFIDNLLFESACKEICRRAATRGLTSEERTKYDSGGRKIRQVEIYSWNFGTLTPCAPEMFNFKLATLYQWYF